MSEFSDQIRKSFTEGDNVRDGGLAVPENLERFTDLSYGPDPKWQVLDIYRPKQASAYETVSGKLPVIISVHGGAWMYGDKERYQYYTMSLAQRGFAVINYTYRLAPEFKFPAGLEDLNLVVQFALKNADRYGLDMNNVFAVGDSAGGNYLGLYACLTTNEKYAASYDFKTPVGFSFRAAAFNCACYHPGDSELDQKVMWELLPNKGTEKEMEQLQVEKHITKNFPPSFVMSGTGDFLKDQLGMIEPVLLANDIPHEVRYYTAQNDTRIQKSENSLKLKETSSEEGAGDDKNTVLGHVFHLNLRRPEATECNDDECAFFRKFLK